MIATPSQAKIALEVQDQLIRSWRLAQDKVDSYSFEDYKNNYNEVTQAALARDECSKKLKQFQKSNQTLLDM